MPTFTLSRPHWKLRDIARVALGVVFMGASLPHFFASEAELQLIPRSLPLRRTALYISGIFELLCGIGVLIPRFQQTAGRGLAALLVAIFPANIYHAMMDIQTGKIAKTRFYHIGRGPIQGLLIWWALWATNKGNEK